MPKQTIVAKPVQLAPYLSNSRGRMDEILEWLDEMKDMGFSFRFSGDVHEKVVFTREVELASVPETWEKPQVFPEWPKYANSCSIDCGWTPAKPVDKSDIFVLIEGRPRSVPYNWDNLPEWVREAYGEFKESGHERGLYIHPCGSMDEETLEWFKAKGLHFSWCASRRTTELVHAGWRYGWISVPADARADVVQFLETCLGCTDGKSTLFIVRKES